MIGYGVLTMRRVMPRERKNMLYSTIDQNRAMRITVSRGNLFREEKITLIWTMQPQYCAGDSLSAKVGIAANRDYVNIRMGFTPVEIFPIHSISLYPQYALQFTQMRENVGPIIVRPANKGSRFAANLTAEFDPNDFEISAILSSQLKLPRNSEKGACHG